MRSSIRRFALRVYGFVFVGCRDGLVVGSAEPSSAERFEVQISTRAGIGPTISSLPQRPERNPRICWPWTTYMYLRNRQCAHRPIGSPLGLRPCTPCLVGWNDLSFNCTQSITSSSWLAPTKGETTLLTSAQSSRLYTPSKIGKNFVPRYLYQLYIWK